MGKQDWDWDVSIGSNFDTSLKIGKPYWDYERNVVSLGRLPARLQCPEHARVIASRRHWDPSWFHMRTKKSLQLMSQGYRVSWRYFKISCQLYSSIMFYKKNILIFGESIFQLRPKGMLASGPVCSYYIPSGSLWLFNIAMENHHF